MTAPAATRDRCEPVQLAARPDWSEARGTSTAEFERTLDRLETIFEAMLRVTRGTTT